MLGMRDERCESPASAIVVCKASFAVRVVRACACGGVRDGRLVEGVRDGLVEFGGEGGGAVVG
jgi:hypothetical protein